MTDGQARTITPVPVRALRPMARLRTLLTMVLYLLAVTITLVAAAAIIHAATH